MIHEQPGEFTPIEATEAIDTKWYEQFEAIGRFQAYEYLDGDKENRNAQRQQFLSKDIENPTLDYPKIDTEKLKSTETALRALKKDILKEETNEIVRQLYRWRVNEKIGELRILQAAAEGNDRNFRRYSEFVYGQPSEEVFAYTVQSIQSITAQHKEAENPELQQAAMDLLEALPQNLPDAKISELPSTEQLELARQETLRELGDLINIEFLSEEKQYNAEEITEVFQSALENLKAEGWKAVIDTSSKTSISVDQEQRAIKIPESRQLVFQQLQTLIAHEAGTHVARRIAGQRSKLKLLSLGLDRYERGEEGVATLREQAIRNKITDFAGLDGHLSIGLAYGLDGTPRNFRDVFEISKKFSYFFQIKKGKTKEEAQKIAENYAWNRTVRTFRGTGCNTPGACFTKDIIYREGNIGTWDVIRDNPDELMRF